MMPFFFSYNFILNGPSFANVPEANDLVATFATAAAPNVEIMPDLSAIILLLRLLTAPAISPFKAVCTAVENPDF